MHVMCDHVHGENSQSKRRHSLSPPPPPHKGKAVKKTIRRGQEVVSSIVPINAAAFPHCTATDRGCHR